MASEPPGYVGRMEPELGSELTFFADSGRVTIDTGGLAIVLDAARREEFQRLFMEAERRAEAHAAEEARDA